MSQREQWWEETNLQPRVDHAASGAAPHQTLLKPQHPEWFRPGDVLRVGAERLVGTGKFFYGNEIMRALNEAVQVQAVRDDGRLVLERGLGGNPPQRIKRGDVLYIIGSAT